MRAWEALAETYGGFLRDVNRASAHAEEAGLGAQDADERARAMGIQVQGALLSASINSVAASMGPDLVRRLVESHIWTTTRARMHARLLSKREHVEVLSWLVPHFASAQQGEVLAEALAVTLEIEDPYTRSLALVAMAERLPEADRAQALAEVLVIARDLIRPWRSHTLATVAERLPDPMEAMAAVRSIEDDVEHLAEAIVGLYPHLKRLPANELYQLWCQAVHGLAMQHRGGALRNLVNLQPLAKHLGGSRASSHMINAIILAGRWFP